MDKIFEVMDKTGRVIYLPKKQWKHISSDHPMMVHAIYQMRETLIKPLAIKTSVNDENVKEYYRYEKEGREYIIVVVKYLNGTGYIITSSYVRKIRQ